MVKPIKTCVKCGAEMAGPHSICDDCVSDSYEEHKPEPPRKHKWEVHTTPGCKYMVNADTLKIEGGALVFRNGDGLITDAYGEWLTVFLEEEEP